MIIDLRKVSSAAHCGLLVYVVALMLMPFQSFANDEANKAIPSPRLSVQLWSVRDQLQSDFVGTIKQLAGMGFEGVELAGEFGPYTNDPEGLAKLIKSYGMQISSAHVSLQQFDGDKFEQTMSFYKAAGVPTLVIPWDVRAFSVDTVELTIRDLTSLLKRVEQYGLRLGYHNHAPEFADYEHHTLWDHIAQSTPKSMVLQLDVGWAHVAGKNPADFVRAYPGQTVLTHFKAKLRPQESDRLPIIGQDTLNWEELFDAVYQVGGTQWIVLEQEDYPEGMSSIEAVRASKKGLEKYLPN